MHDAKIPDTVISTPRLELRHLMPADAAEIFAAMTPELTRFIAWEPPTSPAAMAGSLLRQMSAMAAGTDLHLVIRLKDGREFLGRAGLHAIGNAEPELGIWIKEMAQSRGYGSEAIAASAAWAAPRFAIANFLWPVAEENVSSRRLAEGLGGVPIRSTVRPKFRAIITEFPPHDPARAAAARAAIVVCNFKALSCSDPFVKQMGHSSSLSLSSGMSGSSSRLGRRSGY